MRAVRWFIVSALCAIAAAAFAGCSAAEDSLNAGGKDSAADAGGSAGGGGGGGGGSGEMDGGGGGAAKDAGSGSADVYIPPEKPVYVPSPPVASKNYVYVLNGQNGTVVRINPATLEIKSIKVGAQPKALLTIAGSDTAVALNTGSQSLTLIKTVNNADHVTSVNLGARYTSLMLDPSGRYAIAYYNIRDLAAPDLIGEEKLTIVDLEPEGGAAPTVTKRHVDAQVTDIFFSEGRNEAYVLSKSAVQVIPFALLPSYEILPRIKLDAAFTLDIPNRTSQAAGDADYIMIRGIASTELLVVDMKAGSLSSATTLVDLGGVPTDLQTTPGATHAVVVLRAESLMKIIKIPEGFKRPDDPEYVEPTTIDLSGYLVGTLRIAHNAGANQLLGLLYTNAIYDEHLLLIDLDDPARLQYLGNADNLYKAIYNTVVAPDGLSALIIHQRATISAETNPSDRQIDEAEGFSIFQIPTRTFAFTRTTTKPGAFTFSDSGRWCAVTVENTYAATHQVYLLNMPLASTPDLPISLDTKSLYVGALTRTDESGTSEVFYVTQEHSAGRITFITVPAVGDGPPEIRTVTGFEINSMGD